MRTTDWSPATYLKFEDERTRPARDLLAQVGDVEGAIIDMGCGPGNSTELLVERFPDRSVIGLDSSATMLAEARLRLPGVVFAVADATTWLPPSDTGLVFANAIYQWVPEHLETLPRVLAGLKPGATLAVQMPDNLAEPTHRLMSSVAADAHWADRLASAAREKLSAVSAYYDALAPFASRLEIWHTVYNHVMPDAAAIVEWVRGTGLRPFLLPLSPNEQAEFLARYLAEIERAYPPLHDSKRLLRFPRLFIVARR